MRHDQIARCATNLREVRRDKYRWLIYSFKQAIERLPESPDNLYRQHLISQLEEKL